MSGFSCPDASTSRSRRGPVAGLFSERFLDYLLRRFQTYFGCGVFMRTRWDTVFYDTLCMSALSCRHKCQFVFALIFVDLLKGFLGSFEVPKLEKSLKFKLGGEIRMQMSFWSSPDRLFSSQEGVLDPRPQNCPDWGPGGVKGKTAKALVSVLSSKALLGAIWEPFPRIFYDFLRFYQAKVQFPKKNITFTCITAMSGVCYAGKNAILIKHISFTCMTDTLDPSQVPVMQVKVMIENEKIHFYLHNRHLAWLLCK